MKKIFLLSLALFASAYVLDFPGDTAPDAPLNYPDVRDNAARLAAEQAARAKELASSAATQQNLLAIDMNTAPAGQWQDISLNQALPELDTQLVVLLSMMPREKLYALKLALDRMFEPQQTEQPQMQSPQKDIQITVHSNGSSKTYKLQNSTSPKNSNVDIKIR